MSADELRQAAATLRKQVSEVEASGCGWWSRDGLVAMGAHHVLVDDAVYVATMNPKVGLALAEWLDDEAARRYHAKTPPDRALAVARLINGGAA